ncbi:MAG TPA: cysteine desulfurase NifS [Planctomycetota bacterium]|nr:cysteine desulfurase NifS [Planctomycetota bacterium]
MKQKTVYLDNAATTRVRTEVIEAMSPYFDEIYANPSSLHQKGREARLAIEKSREQVAGLLGADSKEIIFTSGGTESDNLAIFGAALANRSKGNHIITSQVEHHAVLNSCHHLEKQGFKITYLPVDSTGVVMTKELEKAVKKETILVTIMHSNNEVGTIQPMDEIAGVCADKKVLLHTDAVQSLGKMKFNLQKSNINLLSLTAHKFYGPKGVGVLYIRKGTKINPLQVGGHHEFHRRAGTENTPGIIGLAKAMELVYKEMDAVSKRIIELRNRLREGLSSKIDEIKINGNLEKGVPHILNVSFRYVEGESILLNLDSAGICVSSGSACTSESLEPSHVLSAMGVPVEIAHGSIRFSLSRETTKEEIDFTVETTAKVIKRLREMSPLYKK